MMNESFLWKLFLFNVHGLLMLFLYTTTPILALVPIMTSGVVFFHAVVLDKERFHKFFVAFPVLKSYACGIHFTVCLKLYFVMPWELAKTVAIVCAIMCCYGWLQLPAQIWFAYRRYLGNK